MAENKLTTFISEMKVGFARNNRFDTQITMPAQLMNNDVIKNNLRRLSLFCDSAQLPGQSFSSAQVRSYGEFKEVPYEKLYEPVSMSFYVDAGMVVKKIFDEWMALVQKPTMRDFNYPDVYQAPIIDIYVYDDEEHQRYKVSLHECWPKAVSPIQMDYASKDLMKIQVQFAYKYFSTERLNENLENVGIPDAKGFLGLGKFNYGFPSSPVFTTLFNEDFFGAQSVINQAYELSQAEPLDVVTGLAKGIFG